MTSLTRNAADDALLEDLVTVVVPARNEQDFIRVCLESVLAQEHAHLEVLVVDGGSTDATTDIVREVAAADPRVRLLHNPLRVIPLSLNLALREARGRWLVRVDAHATIPPGYVSRAVQHLATGRWGGVGGRKDGVGVTPAGRAIAAAMASPFGVGNSTYHYGRTVQTVEHVPFGAYVVDEVRDLGGWDERLRVNQDFEFDHRLRATGRQLLFDPDLVIDWQCRQTIPDLYRQYFRYGRGKVTVALLHPGSVRARHLAAPGLVAWLVGAAATLPRRPATAAVLVAPYALAVASASVSTAAGLPGSREKAHVPVAFVAMHLGWGLGFWRGLGDRAAGAVRAARRGTGQA